VSTLASSSNSSLKAQSDAVASHDKTSGENPADSERQKDLR
jgi:hypothetical protein